MRQAAALTIAGLGVLLFAGPAQAVVPAQIVQVINAERQANGLPPVREDPGLSAGCAQYDNYRRMNGSLSNAFPPGREDPSKPGYTAAGSQASRNSLLNAGDRPADSWAGGDVFDDAPNHLRSLMDPAVAVVGADQLDFNLGPPFGTASLSCVDVRSAPGRAAPRRLHLYTYIGPDGKAPRNPTVSRGSVRHGTVHLRLLRRAEGDHRDAAVPGLEATRRKHCASELRRCVRRSPRRASQRPRRQ
jgi:hypothetical protein